MKTRDELIHTIGKIQANIQLGKDALTSISHSGQSHATNYGVRYAKAKLVRIQELLDEIEKED
jgi:hypothetical protein|tara:strand:+ start:258 stop:446 length:189 start_codon:yes stop_codon:yes gene_type:complete